VGTEGVFTLGGRITLPRNARGYKARGAANGCSIGKPSNAVATAFRGNPKGKGLGGRIDCVTARLRR
jgi:hypothetical protein